MNYKYVIYDIDGYLDEEAGFPSYKMAEDKAIKTCINMLHKAQENFETIPRLKYYIEEVRNNETI